MSSDNIYVYIMTNKPLGVLYVGATNDLEKRVWEHQNSFYKKSFTARCNLHLLVYYEHHIDPLEAITREKQFKAGSRNKKIQAIESMNPSWRDLSLDFLL